MQSTVLRPALSGTLNSSTSNNSQKKKKEHISQGSPEKQNP